MLSRLPARALFLLVLVSGAEAFAAAPAAGEPQVLRQGFFANVDMGGFFTVGGRDFEGDKGLSDPQAYLQLGAGYDLSRQLSLAVSFGIGASAGSCFGEVNAAGICVESLRRGSSATLADHFTATMFALEGSYKHNLTERLTLQPRLQLGLALLEPAPVVDAAGAEVFSGVITGLALGVEYVTQMDHFSIGADVYSRLIVGANILAFAVYPKIKYTF